MDVKCEKCSTEYEFDDRKVTEAGITVKCTNCGHLFRVVRQPARFDASPAADAHDPSQEMPRPRRSNWMIRNAAGEVREFKDLATLQQWIAQGKVAPDDQISKSGETWKPLGTIVELSSMFSVPGGPARPAGPPPPPPMGPGMVQPGFGQPELSFGAQPGRVVTPQPMPGVGGPEMLGTLPPGQQMGPAGPYMSGAMPAMRLSQPMSTLSGYPHHGPVSGPMASQQFQMPPGTYGDASQSSSPLVFTPDAVAPRREPGGAARGFALGVLATIALAGVAYFVHDQFGGESTPPPAASQPQGTPGSTEAAMAALDRAEASLGQDSEAGRRAAKREAEAALQALGTPPTSERYAGRAKAIQAWALITEAEYAALEGHPADLQAAESLVQEARRLAGDDPLVQLVHADLHRVGGRVMSARRMVAEAKANGADPATVALLEGAVDLHANGPVAALADRMSALSPAAAGVPRGRYLQAVALNRAERKSAARQALTTLLATHPNHGPGQRLLATLDRETVVAKPATPASAAPSAAPASAPAPAKPAAAKPVVAARKKSGTSSPSGSFDSLLRRGGDALERGKTTQARRYFEAALKKNNRSPEVWSNLAWCDLDQGRTTSAVAHFRKALARSARYADAMYGLGSALEQAGRKTEAAEAYKRYLGAHGRGRHANMVRRKLSKLDGAP